MTSPGELLWIYCVQNGKSVVQVGALPTRSAVCATTNNATHQQDSRQPWQICPHIKASFCRSLLSLSWRWRSCSTLPHSIDVSAVYANCAVDRVRTGAWRHVGPSHDHMLLLLLLFCCRCCCPDDNATKQSTFADVSDRSASLCFDFSCFVLTRRLVYALTHVYCVHAQVTFVLCVLRQSLYLIDYIVGPRSISGPNIHEN